MTSSRIVLWLHLGIAASACASPPRAATADAREAKQQPEPARVEPPASPQSAIDTEDPPANTVITLQRGGCERRCAVYRIVIFADGTAIYEGRHYVRKTGVVVEKLEISAVRSLIEAFRSIDYFALRSDYGYGSNDGCESEVLDEPIAMTSIVVGTQSKAIVHHHRCIGPVPTKLRELEDEIDRALNSVRWIR